MLRRNLIANYLGQGWVAIISIAFVPWYIHYLGMEAYGLIGIFAMLQAWMTLFDAGMAPALNREMARFMGGKHSTESIRDLLRTVEVFAVLIAICISLLLVTASDWLAISWARAEKLEVREVATAFAAMGLVLALRLFEGVYRAALLGLMYHVSYNVIACVLATVKALGAVFILAFVSRSVTAFFMWQALLSFASVLVMMMVTYRVLPTLTRYASFSLKELQSVWRFAAGVAGITLLALFLSQVDKVLLSKLLTLTEYGHYALASLVAGVTYNLVSPVTQTWFPKLSQLHASDDQDALAKAFHDGAQLVAVMLGSCSMVIIVFAEEILTIWTRNASIAHESAPLLRLLVTGNLLNGLIWIPYQTQLACGWTTLAIRFNLAASVAIVPAVLWAAPQFGAIGAAWVWVALNTGYVAVMGHLMYRRILQKERAKWYFQDIFAPVGAATVAVALASLALPGPESPTGQLFTIFIAGLLAAAAALLCSSHLRARALHMLPRLYRASCAK